MRSGDDVSKVGRWSLGADSGCIQLFSVAMRILCYLELEEMKVRDIVMLCCVGPHGLNFDYSRAF